MALADAEADELVTGEIRKEIGVNNNRAVLYRVKEYLEPAGLVDRWKEPYKGIQEKTLLSLTESGEEFINQHREEIDRPRTIEEVHDLVQDISGEVEAQKERVREINGKRGHLTKLQEELENRLAGVDELESAIKEVERHADRAESAQDSIVRYRDEIKDTQEEAEQASRNHERRVESLEKQWRDKESEIDQVTSELKGEIHQVERLRGDIKRDVEDLEARVRHAGETIEKEMKELESLKKSTQAVLDDAKREQQWLHRFGMILAFVAILQLATAGVMAVILT